MKLDLTSINLTLGPRDKLKPCPFCGGTELSLENTHTPSYWISCECGVEMHGRALGTTATSHEARVRAHQRGKRAAIAAWNSRAVEDGR